MGSRTKCSACAAVATVRSANVDVSATAAAVGYVIAAVRSVVAAAATAAAAVAAAAACTTESAVCNVHACSRKPCGCVWVSSTWVKVKHPVCAMCDG